ncbi:MAG: histidine phosphatase family protein [Thermoleophilaceae bacterium]
MKRLYLLRHAKSSWSDPSLADEERPLAPRGRKAAKKMAKELRRREIRPKLVLCSSSRRTQETLELIGSSLGDPTIEVEVGLYGAGSDGLLARMRAVSDTVGSVLVIGHNPGLQDLALRLAPGSERLVEKFPTGVLAAFELDVPNWRELGQTEARLAAYVVPREL